MKKMGIKGQHILSALFAMVIAVLLLPMLSGCGKESAASPSGLNTQLNIINVSPDRFPIDFYINFTKQNTKSYIYSVPSGYFYVTSLQTPVQLRTQKNITFYTVSKPFVTNCKYSMFVTGLLADKTDTTIFTTDTSAIPALGRAKVRFVNASAKAVNLDVYANGTIAYKSQGFLAVSGYLEIPAGVYDFKICPAGSTTTLTDLPNTTVQDGRLYTLYTRGVVGRADSALFAASIITNR
jgi:hypothetical protein